MRKSVRLQCNELLQFALLFQFLTVNIRLNITSLWEKIKLVCQANYKPQSITISLHCALLALKNVLKLYH